jgi:chromate transporter
MFALSVTYAHVGQLPLLQGLFWGIKAAVVAIVLQALLKIAGKALKRPLDWWLAGLAFLAVFGFGLPFVLVVAAAALTGFLLPQGDVPGAAMARPSVTQTLRTIALWAAIWLVPLAALYAGFGGDHLFAELAGIFSTLAVVTFGGAYAVLASLGQSMVEQHGWLTTAQMMDGFGLAETTPGPLILVGQFTAYMAASNTQGGLWNGAIASVIFLWMTFVPCLLWIFAGAPWIAWLDSRPRLRTALAAVTAAVTGVILNLALWFALHVVFATVERLAGPVPVWWPDLKSFDPAALILAVLLAIALLRLHAGIPKTLALGLVAGLIWTFAPGLM